MCVTSIYVCIYVCVCAYVTYMLQVYSWFNTLIIFPVFEQITKAIIQNFSAISSVSASSDHA